MYIYSVSMASCLRCPIFLRLLWSPSTTYSCKPYLVSSFGSTVTASQIPDSIGFPSSCGTGSTPLSNLLMGPCWKLLSRLHASVIICAQMMWGLIKGMNHYFALCFQASGKWSCFTFWCFSQSLDVIHPQHRVTIIADRRIWQTWSNFTSAM